MLIIKVFFKPRLINIDCFLRLKYNLLATLCINFIKANKFKYNLNTLPYSI